jgi:hypothetical protein
VRLTKDGGMVGNIAGVVSPAVQYELVDAGKTWTPNCWAGARVEIIGDPINAPIKAKGQIRSVVSNTNTALTVDIPWDGVPAAGLTGLSYRLYFRPNVLSFSAVN